MLKHPLCIVGAAVFAYFVTNACAQVQAPSPGDRVDTPSKITLPKKPAKLEIFGAGGIPANFKAQPNAPFDVTVNVSVRNSGEQTGNYFLTAVIPEAASTPRTGPLRLEPGGSSRIPFRIQTNIGSVYFQGEQMPIVIRLMGADGKQLDDHRLTVQFANAAATATTNTAKRSDGVSTIGNCAQAAARRASGPTGELMRQAQAGRTTSGPNLALIDASVGDFVGRRPIDITGDSPHRIKVRVNVQSTQPGARWGYAATLRYTVTQGTPETGLKALHGASGGSAALPGNLAPNEVRSVEMNFDRAAPLVAGMWHTLDVYIDSSADTDASDNARRVLFMYDDRRQLVEQCDFPGQAPRMVGVTKK